MAPSNPMSLEPDRLLRAMHVSITVPRHFSQMKSREVMDSIESVYFPVAAFQGGDHSADSESTSVQRVGLRYRLMEPDILLVITA